MKKLFLLTFFVFGITKSESLPPEIEALENPREARLNAQFIKRIERAVELYSRCRNFLYAQQCHDLCIHLTLQQLEQEHKELVASYSHSGGY